MHKFQKYLFLALNTVLLFGFNDGSAQEHRTNLIVGTKHSPPFSIKDEHGNWSGISIDLWRLAAEKMGITYEYQEFELDELIKGVSSGKIDVATAAITITPEREKSLDFSHPYYVDGLGIAVPTKAKRNWSRTILNLFSSEFMQAIGALIIVLLISGLLVWAFERRNNAEQFGGKPLEGLGSGFWWAAVTMTTVGYGDKSPRTLGGRLVALVWMFASIIVISGFTAGIASSLTVNRLESDIRTPEDLARVSVGTLPNSTSSQYLSAHYIDFTNYTSLDQGLGALRQGKIDAFVYDVPLLQNLISKKYPSTLSMLPFSFEDQLYALAFRSESNLREPINRTILEIIKSSEWKNTLHEYLGD